MEISEPERLDRNDVAAAMALSTAAGWNQTEDDWRLFIDRGTVLCVRADGVPAATAAVLPYDGFGFIAMVLTTAEQRGRGLAAVLLTRSVRWLAEAGLVPMLDATPAGRPIYERQGFVPVDALERWVIDAVPAVADAVNTPSVGGEGAICTELDAAAFGARRGFLFDDFLGRLHTRSIVDDDAFVLARAGRIATQIGPLVAPDEDRAARLLDRLFAHLSGPAFIDVPVRWRGLAALLERRGFRRQRAFTRMAQERSLPFGDPQRQFAAAGPEFG